MRKEAKLFKALANERRIKVLEVLTRGPRTVTQISQEIGLSFRSTSKHLQKLESAGLIAHETKSKYVFYSVKKSLSDHIRTFVRMCE